MSWDFEAIGEFFAVEIEWIGDGRTRATVAGTQLEIDNPLSVSPLERPEKVTWPEQLFPTALGACIITTLTTINDKLKVPIESLRVRVKPILALDTDGGFKFEKMKITVSLRVPKGMEKKAERLVDLSHKYCLLSKAIKGNVEEEIKAEIETY